MRRRRKRRRRKGAGALLLALSTTAALAASFTPLAAAAPGDPLFLFAPAPPPPPSPPKPPPTGYLNGPCGLAVDNSGRFWLSDHYHRSVDVFTSAPDYESRPLFSSAPEGSHGGLLDDPCGLALDSSGDLYLNNFHRNVVRFPTPLSTGTATVLAGSSEATGVAVDPSDDHAYVNVRDRVKEYDSTGAFVGDIGAASLDDAYGIAVSAHPSTAGFLYLPDASTDTVKVYDPATDTDDPVQTIAGPPGGFTSLLEASVAVDRFSGDLYVVENTEPRDTESPLAVIRVFSSDGTYEGFLKRGVIHGEPTGIAVDNSASARHPVGTQGRLYVTTGNSHRAGVYAYPPDAAVSGTPARPTVPPPPPGGGELFPTVAIGAATGGGGVECEGDACQALPPEPVDPTLTTLLSGRGNPKVRWRSYGRSCSSLVARARALAKRAGKAKGAKAAKLEREARKAGRLAKSCKQANRGRARASSAGALSSVPGASAAARETAQSGSGASSNPVARGLLPGSSGFDAKAIADGGEAATIAGSHPYRVVVSLALDQGGGEEDLRSLQLDLPPGLLVNPANATGALCSDTAFSTPRTSPLDPATESGEDCPEKAQIGTVEVVSNGETRSFGLFNLRPKAGEAARFGASPFGEQLTFDVFIRSDLPGAYTTLHATEVPEDLEAESLSLSLWGAPWDSTHNAQRGDCLNETEPSFGRAKCSVGEPTTTKPTAFLTLPTLCGAPLEFKARVTSWQDGAPQSASATSKDFAEEPALLTGCAALGFQAKQEALLSTTKASSASGFVFRFDNEDQGLTDPRARIRSLVKKLTVELPDGVTLNPSLGAGLGVCTPSQAAAESSTTPPGAGCPNASKIGVFLVGLPYYEKRLRGSIYLAQPDDPTTSSPGAENPFDSLLAVYLIAKSADRGLFFRIPGRLSPDGEGTLTAVFDELPQLPYTDLEINFRSGQRAPLVSPPRCGAAGTKTILTPWTSGVKPELETTDSPIETGVEDGPCPAGTPPFSPGALAGGVNSNVGSYTPYYVRLTRKDTEQEITSYSLVLPKGITGKLAGVPFCPEVSIEAARTRRGEAEIANPSCPQASQVGRTDTGYGVGKALTYAPGRIYLAGPFKGSPLSLVTVNAAVVGPFDLGTIVIRSAFDVDQRTAQLEIDSSASDPIPHIIDGVPVHLREVRIHMDRFQFTHNPSSCEPSQLVSRLTGSGATFQNPADDSVANVSKHFQLLNCLTLGFKPKLGLRLRGPSRRGAYPSLRATFASRGARDSNLKKIEVEMPHSMFLAQNHIRSVCTKQQFSSENCPKGSVYGKAVAKTLLFDEPLRGNVYLRASNTKLPDLVADLHSGAVRIVVEGRIGPGRHGGILTFFDELPDAPIDSFTMTLRGGKHGLLQNSVDICAQPPLATVSALGQNNVGARFSSVLRGRCKGRGK